jgi:hypothetical protein
VNEPGSIVAYGEIDHKRRSSTLLLSVGEWATDRRAEAMCRIGRPYAVREDLLPKTDLMADIHELEALSSFTLDCASHSR